MKINTKKFIDNILMFFVTILVFSYSGIIASYKSSIIYSIVLLVAFITAILLKKVYIFKLDMGWIVLISYMILILVVNFPKSILYLTLFILGMLILYKKNNKNYFRILIKTSKIISIILTTSILIQYYFPDIFYRIAKIYYFYSNQYDMVYSLGEISHKYSGLIYEVSFSAFILSIGFVSYFCDFINKKSYKFKYIFTLIYIYYGIILTDKRSFILIIPFIMIMIFILFQYKKINFKSLLLLIILSIVIIINYKYIFEIIHKILSDGTNKTIQLSSRNKYWDIVFDMINYSPIIGCGMNSFDQFFNLSHIKNFNLNFAGAHNSYLQIMGEFGILGAIIYLFNIFNLIKKSFKCVISYRLINDKNSLYLVTVATCVLLICMIYALSGNVFYQPQQLIMFFLFGNIITNEYKNIKERKNL